MLEKLNSTGLYADITIKPYIYCYPETDPWLMCKRHWYRASETVRGINPWTGQLTNKKWPLKKVL